MFTNLELGPLHESLINFGDSSEIDALWVGASIEDMDIYDIQNMLKNTDKPDLIYVYENLLKGSKNHLRSFYGLLEKMGEKYEAQYLDQEQVYNILSTAKETGPK